MLCVIALLVSLSLFVVGAQAQIANTLHNLSISGPGPVKSLEESQTCIFCHTPHNSSPDSPLWNRQLPGSTYVPYTSSTTLANPGQPTGASLLCLSCHDGTIALGDVLSRDTNIAMAGGVATMPPGPGLLGTDLSDDHPVSFDYTSALAASRGELADPSVLTGAVKLDKLGSMQCTACHDPHDDSNGKFLVMANHASALCVTCHLKDNWDLASHRTSIATWNGASPDPWPHTDGMTVADNACENCHRPHEAGGPRWLLNTLTEEGNCFACHNGNVANTNIASEFTKLSIHPLAENTAVHDPAEAAITTTRHVECVDCHNPHASNAIAGMVAGALNGVTGITIGGSEIENVTFEYQVCFRCHADSNGQPAPPTTRQFQQVNTREEFQPGNPSHHAVAGPGASTSVPSLIAPLSETSTITCGDCHANNTGPGAGGGGPAGPHGSIYPTLLERRYETADPTPENASVFALCYKCHDRDVILNGGPEKVHKKHLEGEETPCNVCHDPHGISSDQGNISNASRLINFDTDVVSPRGNGVLQFNYVAPGQGGCLLSCHGKDHNNEFTYP